MSYYQKLRWVEDGWGDVVCRISISNTFDGIFDDESVSTMVNVLSIESIEKSLKNSTGGVELKGINFNIHASSTLYANDNACIAQILDAVNNSTLCYIAVFVNTASAPLGSDLLYLGTISPNAEGEDVKLLGSHFDANLVPVRDYKLKSATFDESIFERFSMSDLIYGNTEKNCPGIDATWETANVKDRQGYYSVGDKKVMIYKLVNLNFLLRKLADNLELAISNNSLGTINIEFGFTFVDYYSLPARWIHFQDPYNSIINRFVDYYNRELFMCFKVYPSSLYQWAFADKPAYYAEDVNGTPNEDSLMYARRSIWIAYSTVKPSVAGETSGLKIEHDPKKAKNFRIDKFKSFFECLDQLALNLGMFLRVEWTNQTTITIKFLPRRISKLERITLRSYLKGAIKPTSSSIEGVKYIGKAGYVAVEGIDMYDYINVEDEMRMEPSKYLDEAQGESLTYTISPTVCSYYSGSDNGTTNLWMKTPHNHYFMDGATRRLNSFGSFNAVSLHTALYMFVARDGTHPLSATVEPDYYFTPCGAIASQVNGETQLFYKMSDYLNFIGGLDDNNKLYEYEIELPWMYGAKQNDTITWRGLDVHKVFTIDGEEYKITKIRWSLTSKTITLSAQSLSRVAITQPPSDISTVETPNEDTTSDTGESQTPSGDTSTGTADEQILKPYVVSRMGGGKIVKAIAHNTHYSKICGIATSDAEIDGEVMYKDSGFVESAEFDTIPINTMLYLRTTPSGVNISTTPLSAKSVDEDVFCVVGQIVKNKIMKIKIDKYIYE